MKLASRLNPNRQMNWRELYTRLGIIGSKLPDAGLPLQYIDGVAIYVAPKNDRPICPTASHLFKLTRTQAYHRVRFICPDCGRHISVGRINQHVCPSPPLQVARPEFQP